MTTPTRLRIDFVSDVACPWCAVGVASLALQEKIDDGKHRKDDGARPKPSMDEIGH